MIPVHNVADPAWLKQSLENLVAQKRDAGEIEIMIVDGARMVSPGLVAATIGAAAARPDPFVLALAWHLGPDVQNVSMLGGYDQDAEDALLASIDWRGDGYALFDIATLAPSSRHVPAPRRFRRTIRIPGQRPCQSGLPAPDPLHTRDPAEHPMPEFRAEYARIRGRTFAPPPLPDPLYFGRIPRRAHRFLADDPERE